MIGENSFIGENFKNYSCYRTINVASLKTRTAEMIDYSQYDVILFLAAIVHRRNKIPYNVYKSINIDLPVKAASLARGSGVRQFIFMSSVSVYGNYKSKSIVFDERTPCSPITAYGRSKLEAEIKLNKLNTPDFSVSIIRSPLIYGEHVKGNMYDLIRLVDNFSLLPFADIRNHRSFIAAETLVEYIDRVIKIKAEGIYLATDPVPVSTTKLVELIAKYLNKKVLLFKLPGFLIKLSSLLKPDAFEKLFGSFVLDNSQTLQKLNFSPEMKIEESFRKMVETYMEMKTQKR